MFCPPKKFANQRAHSPRVFAPRAPSFAVRQTDSGIASRRDPKSSSEKSGENSGCPCKQKICLPTENAAFGQKSLDANNIASGGNSDTWSWWLANKTNSSSGGRIHSASPQTFQVCRPAPQPCGDFSPRRRGRPPPLGVRNKLPPAAILPHAGGESNQTAAATIRDFRIPRIYCRRLNTHRIHPTAAAFRLFGYRSPAIPPPILRRQTGAKTFRHSARGRRAKIHPPHKVAGDRFACRNYTANTGGG